MFGTVNPTSTIIIMNMIIMMWAWHAMPLYHVNF
jgi:hypothetical protein